MIRRISNFFSWLCLAVLIGFAAVLLVPRALGMQSFAVLSGSMEPTIPTGSLVFAKAQGSYAAGDIITFQDAGGTVVTHRIVSVDAAGACTTQGDANNVADPHPVPSASIIGKVAFHLPYLGSLCEALKTSAGITAICGVILLLFLSILVPVIVSDVKRNRGEHEN